MIYLFERHDLEIDRNVIGKRREVVCMEASTEEAIKIIEQKLSLFCKHPRNWEIREDKFVALKPIEVEWEGVSIEEKLKRGVIVVDKPPGPTSHEVVAYLKKMLGIKKAGHGGTLEGKIPGEIRT